MSLSADSQRKRTVAIQETSKAWKSPDVSGSVATCVGMCGVKSVGSGLYVQAITTYHLLISRTHTQLLSTLPACGIPYTYVY